MYRCSTLRCKISTIQANYLRFNSDRQSCDVVPQNYPNTCWNEAESNFRRAVTFFPPNYCATLAENSFLKKQNLLRKWIVFLFIIMAENLSDESLTLRFLELNYVNIRVILTVRLQIVYKTTFLFMNFSSVLEKFYLHFSYLVTVGISFKC